MRMRSMSVFLPRPRGGRTSLNTQQSRRIHYGQGIKQSVNIGRQKSPTMDTLFKQAEHHENKLKLRIDKLSPDHDIHKIPRYRERFLRSKELKIEKGSQISYDPIKRKVSLLNTGHHDETAHEVQHHMDHVSKNINLFHPEERLASEFSAFTTQYQVHHEITGRSPKMFDGRSPKQMAESYLGKRAYPGDLASSISAVRSRTNESLDDRYQRLFKGIDKGIDL